VVWVRIDPLDYRQYNRFVYEYLHQFIETDYALIVQDDGWVLDAGRFREEYLNYDYIGAPCHAAIHEGKFYKNFTWVGLESPIVIQNGGFSLRSQKLLRAPHMHGIQFYNGSNPDFQNEDVQLTGLFRSKLESLGIKFAPISLSRAFAVEYFGHRFHDGLNLNDLLGIHGRTRKLIGPKRVRSSISRDDVNQIFGEPMMLRYLESIGYTIEFQ
jgi:hypothetical protein